MYQHTYESKPTYLMFILNKFRVGTYDKLVK